MNDLSSEKKVQPLQINQPKLVQSFTQNEDEIELKYNDKQLVSDINHIFEKYKKAKIETETELRKKRPKQPVVEEYEEHVPKVRSGMTSQVQQPNQVEDEIFTEKKQQQPFQIPDIFGVISDWLGGHEVTEVAELDSCEDLGATGNLPLNKPPLRPSIMSTGSKKDYNAEIEHIDSISNFNKLDQNYENLFLQEKKFLEDVTRKQDEKRKSMDIQFNPVDQQLIHNKQSMIINTSNNSNS